MHKKSTSEFTEQQVCKIEEFSTSSMHIIAIAIMPWISIIALRLEASLLCVRFLDIAALDYSA